MWMTCRPKDLLRRIARSFLDCAIPGVRRRRKFPSNDENCWPPKLTTSDQNLDSQHERDATFVSVSHQKSLSILLTFFPYMMTTISLPSSLRCSKSKCGENVKSRLIYPYIYKLQQSLTTLGALADILHRELKLLHVCGSCFRIVGVGRLSLSLKLRTFIYRY